MELLCKLNYDEHGVVKLRSILFTDETFSTFTGTRKAENVESNLASLINDF